MTTDERVPVHFWAGPADGAVVLCPLNELPQLECEHPEHPGAVYVLFRRLVDDTFIARYAPAVTT